MKRPGGFATIGLILAVVAVALILVATRTWQSRQTTAKVELKPVAVPSVTNTVELDQVLVTLDDDKLDVSAADEASLDADLTEDF